MEAERLTLIGITLPTSTDIADEASRITAMLDSGAISRMHLRKDDPEVARALLDAIPRRLHSRLSLHRIAVPDGCSARAHGPQPDARSRSCHSLDEAEAAIGHCDYLLLSPVFDSISKPGYLAAQFDPARLGALLASERTTRVIALGGVTPEHFATLRRQGFDGAAMLGCLWGCNTTALIDKLLWYNS